MLRGAAEDGIRIEGSIPPSSGEAKRVLLMRRPRGRSDPRLELAVHDAGRDRRAGARLRQHGGAGTPAPSTAVCSGALADCIAEADLPPGVFNFVPGPGPVVGDEIVSNPGTGRRRIHRLQRPPGRKIAERAAGKPLLLEMGGNGPLVVMDDADLEVAAAEAAGHERLSCARAELHGRRAHSSCTRRCGDEFVARLAAAGAVTCCWATRSTTPRPSWAR